MSFDAYAMRAELSAPLEQGNVFRHPYKGLFISRILSQSLWNRAMSFDKESLT